MSEVKKIMVVSNTHWDREFRFSFEKTRHNLLKMLDTTLDILENDEKYHSFTMDGHTLMIEDYLEMRPERTEQVKKLIKAGKLIIGPYYTLPEQFSLCHESLVRNLIYGRKLLDKYGAKHNTVAYTPASWGQTGQYPQILSDFGIDKMMFYRGISHDEAPAEYIWEGADGTQIYASRFALYCRYNWYYQVHRAATRNRVWSKDYNWGEFDDAPFSMISGKVAGDASYELKSPEIRFNENAVEKAVTDMLDEEDGHFTTPIFLAMNGHDISVACPSDTKLIETAKKLFEGRIDVEQTDLEHFWSEAIKYLDKTEMKTLKGERRAYLKEGRWTYLMPSTISARTYLKQQDFNAYNKLVYSAEPLAVMSYAMSGDNHMNYLDRGWKYLLSNHTHDANGGCAPDSVCLDIEYRMRKAGDCADIVTGDCLSDISANMSPDGMEADDVKIMVYNPLPFKRDIIARVKGQLPKEKFSEGFSGDGLEVQIVSAEDSSIFMDSIWEVPTIMNTELFEAYVKFSDVPACGYKTVVLKAYKKPKGRKIASGSVLENKFIIAKVNKNGTITVKDKKSGKIYENLNWLSSRGEIGSAWQHKSPEHNQIFTSKNAIAKIEVVENGELCATVCAEYNFSVPYDCCSTTRSEVLTEIPVKVYYSLKKDSHAIEVKVELDNTAKDHWLRANFETGIKTDYSYSDSHFDIVKRAVKIPDSTGWVEPAYGMQPLRTFATVKDDKNGFAIMPKGLYEYEVFEDTRMALTLIRGCRIRQAVSEEKITVLDDEGILCLGKREFEYAMNFYHDDIEDLPNYAAELFVPVSCAFAGRGKGKLPYEAGFVEVSNEKVHTTCVKPSEDGKGVIIRMCNPCDSEQEVELSFPMGVKKLYKAKMDESISEEIGKEFSIGAKKIFTVFAEI